MKLCFLMFQKSTKIEGSMNTTPRQIDLCTLKLKKIHCSKCSLEVASFTDPQFIEGTCHNSNFT